MKTITAYSPAELKEINPRAFERALSEWVASADVCLGAKIMDSLKAVFKASGIKLTSGSIGAYSYSSVSFDMDDEADLTGQRAVAWLENNLFDGLREKRPFASRVKRYSEKWYSFNRNGRIPDCPLTGVCYDEDFLESLLRDVLQGSTIKEAYHNLADVAKRLMEGEYDYAVSEENFIEQDHILLTEDGDRI